MANKILKTLTLPNAQGEPVTYELHPEWDNIENKPENFGVGEFYEIDGTKTGEIFNDYENNIAKGVNSHAEGLGTIATRDASHVEGQYNIEDTEEKYLHIVGNGTSEAERSNAYTLDENGNAWYAGSMTATKMILGAESYGETLPATGVEGQLFFLVGSGSLKAADNGSGVITLK